MLCKTLRTILVNVAPPTVTTEDLEILPYLLNICLNP